jgi:hypothetical protein
MSGEGGVSRNGFLRGGIAMKGLTRLCCVEAFAAIGLFILFFAFVGCGRAPREIANETKAPSKTNAASREIAKETKAPTKAVAPSWQSDFGEFAKAVKREEYIPGEMVRWTVTFSKLESKTALYFREAESLAKETPPIRVWVSLKDGEQEKAAGLKAGDRVTVSGKMGYPVEGITPAYPEGYLMISPHECIIEDIGH